MRHLLKWLCVLAFNFIPVCALCQPSDFNADSAYVYTHYLSETIGPRPMGSHNERRALAWVVSKLATFGADTAYLMPFYQGPNGVNTTSGVAVGIFRGRSDSTIVIGGHIDSDTRTNPGASDNASGAACVVELARNWAQTGPQRYTLLFAAFGGEEKGLVGSKFFVRNYPHIDDVVLMFSIDMAATRGWLIPFIDSRTHQTPRWLVADAFAFDQALGYNDLTYPTHFFSINSAIGAASSDHLPFMSKNIPAIDFTAGINYDPIHTPQDEFKFVQKPMLARSGRLVGGLLQKYQTRGIPAGKTDHYLLWETIFGRLFIPLWLITVYNVLVVLLGLGMLLQARKFRQTFGRDRTGRFTGIKVFVLMTVIVLFAQAGEGGLQLLKGIRYPWLAHFDKYMIYAGLFAAAGGWVAAQITRFWKFSNNPYRYASAATIWLLVFVLGLFGLSVRLAAYPAISLFVIFLIVNIHFFPLQLLLSLLASLPLLRLLFMETLPFVARSLTALGFQITSFGGAFIYTAILTLIFTVWLAPSLYIFAFVIKNHPAGEVFVGQFRRWPAGLVLLLVLIGYGGYLYALPAFNERWQPLLKVEARYDQNSGRHEGMISSNDFLQNVQVSGDNFVRSYHGKVLTAELPLNFRADWWEISGSNSFSGGAGDTVNANWQLVTQRPWYSVEMTLYPDSGGLGILAHNLSYQSRENQVRFRWEAEPPDTLQMSVRLLVTPGANLIREVKAVYPVMPVPLTVQAKYGKVQYQTVVTRKDTLSVGR